MDASQVPVGQTITVANTSYIRTTFTRTNHNEGILEQFDPVSGRLVLRARMDVSGNSQNFEFVDTTFWSVTLNGQPVIGLPNVSNVRINADPQTRTFQITT